MTLPGLGHLESWAGLFLLQLDPEQHLPPRAGGHLRGQEVRRPGHCSSHLLKYDFTWEMLPQVENVVTCGESASVSGARHGVCVVPETL